MFTMGGEYKKIHKLLKLDKPLVIFDIETTGISMSSDKIIEIAYIKIWGDGKIKKENVLLNPETPISEEATTIHGSRNEDVALKPAFRDKAQELWDVFSGCYYGGFSILDFDLPVLRREFVRVGMDFDYSGRQVIDSKKIYNYMAPSNLASAYDYYCRKRLTVRKNIMEYAEAAAEVLMKQMERYNEVRDWGFINRIHEPDDEFRVDNIRKFYWEKGEACFAFSKYQGKALSWVAENDPEFLRWILESDFTEQTKNMIRLALEKMKERAGDSSDGLKK